MKNKIFGIIYKITNLVNGKIYIGQTTDSLNKRFQDHINKSNEILPNMAIARAIKKYGKENFIIDQIDIAYSQKELNCLEGKYIAVFKSLITENGYNIREVDLNGVSKHSKQTKEKLSKAHSTDKNKQIASNKGKKRRGKSVPNTSSKYVGVYFLSQNQWRSNARFNNKIKHLGVYNTEIEAAQARDIEELNNFGDNAILNFPELKEQYLTEQIKPKKRIKGKNIKSNKKSDSNIVGVRYRPSTNRWRFQLKGFKEKTFKTKEEAEAYALECYT